MRKYPSYFICSCEEMWRTPSVARCAYCGDVSSSVAIRRILGKRSMERDRGIYRIVSNHIFHK